MKTTTRSILPPPIELLEPRIAPASTLAFVDAHTATYTDTDGDHVSVHFSKPLLTQANVGTVLQMLNSGAGDWLGILQLSAPPSVAAAAKGTDITVSVQQAGNGDGLAVVGGIEALGVNLGTVKIQGDLGTIDVGTGEVANVALRKLDVQSMHLYGNATSSGTSNIFGQLGALKIATDFEGGSMDVSDHAAESNARIGSIFIGGSLADKALINASGSIGAVHVGTIVRGGQIFSTGDIGAVTVPGGIVALPSGTDPAIESIDGGIASVTIGGTTARFADVRAKHDVGPVKLSGQFGGTIESTAGSIGSVTVAGSLAGIISGAVNVGAVRIGGDILDRGGVQASNGKLASVKVGGSMINGGILASTLGPISVAHDVIAEGLPTHAINAITIASLKIGGSLISNDPSMATVAAQGDCGPVSIGHDVVSGGVAGSRLKSLKIGGSVSNAAFVSANTELGPVTVGGDLTGGSFIGTGIGAIDSVRIGGSVTGKSFIQAQTNLGPVTIGHSLVGSSLKSITGSIGAVRVGDSISATSLILAKTDLLSLRVGNNVTASGVGASTGRIGSVTIGGALGHASLIEAKTTLGAISVGGDVIEASNIQTDAGEITSLAVKGSLRDSSINAFTALVTATIGGDIASSAINVGTDITSIKIAGSIVMSETFDATVSATGKIAFASVGGMVGGSIKAHSLGTVKITGSVFSSTIQSTANVDSVSIGGDLVRSTINATGTTGQPVSIGSVSIHGTALDSNILAGVMDNSNNGFGNNDDTLVASTSTITSISVGAVVSDGPAKPIAFEAEEITSLKIAGHAIALQAGSSNDTVQLSPIAGKYTLHEVP